MTRKEWKRAGRRSLKKHYWFFLMVCLIAAILSVNYTESTIFTSANTRNSILEYAKGLFHISVDKAGDKSKDKEAAAGETEAAAGETETADSETVSSYTGITDVLTDYVLGQWNSAADFARTLLKIDSSKDQKVGGLELGHSRGVLAMLINNISSGAFLVMIFSAIWNMVGSARLASILLVILSILVLLLFYIFISNVYEVIMKRIFMEGLIYEKNQSDRFIYLMRLKKWGRAAGTMFIESMYLFFWSLTIVGGVIKMLSYAMVPYIVAENPDISAKEAITLSRKMMDGHKWELLLLHLSFLGWYLLAVGTLGLSSLFYSAPYKEAVICQYFYYIRGLAKEKEIPSVEKLNDIYLYKKAPREVINRVYEKDLVYIERSKILPEKRKGFAGFIADNFGLILRNDKLEEAYRQNIALVQKTRMTRDVINGTAYPRRLNPIPEKRKNKHVEQVGYARHYSVCSMIMIFFTLSVFGFLWEVSLHLISEHKYVKRGVLHGYWLPIYGFGVVLILLALNRFRDKMWLEFLSAVILCGCVEYFTSVSLELAHNGAKWWDYSGYFLNLDGRICAEGLLVFGLGGIAVVYIVGPLLDNFFGKIKLKYMIPICAVLLILFTADQIYSKKHPNTGAGITDTSACVEYILPDAGGRISC